MKMMAITPTMHDKTSSAPTSKAVWSYGVGDIDDSMDDSTELSARFTAVVPQHQPSKSSDDISAPPSNKHQSMDLDQVFPLLSCEEQPQGVTILEETDDASSSDHENHTEVPPLPSTPPPPTTPKQKKANGYSDSWDELQLTPMQMLSKLMPNKVKDAQAKISAKKQQGGISTPPRSKISPLPPSAGMYKTMSRSECRSTTLLSVASWSENKFNHPNPNLQDKKKWGMDSLRSDLLQKEGTKKKKKSSRSSKTKEKKGGSGMKKCYSCPIAVDEFHKEESKKKKKSRRSDSPGKKKKSKSKSASKTVSVQLTGN